MKPLPLILGFLPLVAFSLLARLLPTHDFGIVALISAVIAVIAIVAHRPVWPPMILTGTQLPLLVILTIVGFAAGAGPDRWLATWLAPAFTGIMGLIILALIPVMPFTEQSPGNLRRGSTGARRPSRRSTACSAPPGVRPSS